MVNANRLIAKYEDSIRDNYAIVSSSMKGLHANAFFDLVTLSGINRNELAEVVFGISLKTMLRYKQDKKKLTPRSSETALKLFALYKQGIAVFGSTEAFNRWLSKPAFGLGNQIPMNLLNTATGIDLIREELTRIEFGNLA